MRNNDQDGLNILATESSRALIEVTSTAVPAVSGAHEAHSTAGDTIIADNGRDGVHIETTGGRSDIVITSTTADTTISETAQQAVVTVFAGMLEVTLKAQFESAELRSGITSQVLQKTLTETVLL